MPGFDGRGPAGAGPLTGGGRGFCIAPVSRRGVFPYLSRRPRYSIYPLFAFGRLGMGLRRGRRRGRSARWRSYRWW